MFIARNKENKEQWDRLLFLLQDPEGTNVFWVNCDTEMIKKILRDLVTEHLPAYKPFDVYLDQSFVSLTAYLREQEKNIPTGSIIHVFGLEEALNNLDFLHNLNFERDTLFRDTPANLIFWTDFDAGTLLMRKAYDFWSWVFFTFNFKTPDELLTARQKGFAENLMLEDKEIVLPTKDSSGRIRHLENEWLDFLHSVSGKPSSLKQMKDAVTIAMALAREYRNEEEYKKAIDILIKLLELNPNVITEDNKGQVWNELGLLYSGKADYLNAKKYLESAFEIVLKLYGRKSLNTATVQSNLGALYTDTEKYDKAKEILEDAIKIYSEVYIGSHPNKARDESNLGTVYLHLREYDKAKKILENAMNFSTKFYGEDHPIVAKIGSNLSIAYWESGNLDKAKNLLQKAVNIIKNNYGDNNLRIANQYNNLAFLFYDSSDKTLAKNYMLKAYEIFKNTLGDNNPKTQHCLSFLKNLEKNDPRPTP